MLVNEPKVVDGVILVPDAAAAVVTVRLKVPVKDRPFDMAYSWGKQPTLACPTLQMADGVAHPDLRSVYKNYFARMKDAIPPR